MVHFTNQLNEGTTPMALLRWTVVFFVFMKLYSALIYSCCFLSVDVLFDAFGSLAIHSFPPTYDVVDNSNVIRCGGVGEPSCHIGIEKIIHQTYKSEALLAVDHPEWKDTPRLWKEAHPKWKYIFWSDQSSREFIEKEYPWFLETYDSYPKPIQRADAIRYFALYHFGGLYADMDLTPRKNIEGLLQGADVVLFETPNVGMTNMIMASRKGSRYIQCLTENLKYFQDTWYKIFGPSFKIMTSTGPTFLFAMTAVNRCGVVFKNDEHLRIIQPSVMGRCSCCKVTCDKSIGILNHLVGSSWHTWDAILMQQLFLCNPAPMMVLLITLFKVIRSLRNDLQAWTSCNYGKLLAYLRSADGIRQIIALFISNLFFQWRRYLGP